MRGGAFQIGNRCFSFEISRVKRPRALAAQVTETTHFSVLRDNGMSAACPPVGVWPWMLKVVPPHPLQLFAEPPMKTRGPVSQGIGLLHFVRGKAPGAQPKKRWQTAVAAMMPARSAARQ